MATKNLMIRCVADFSGLTKATESAKKGVASLKRSADSAGISVKNCGNKATKAFSGLKKAAVFTAIAVAAKRTASALKELTTEAIGVDSQVDNLSRTMSTGKSAFLAWAKTGAAAFGISESAAIKYGNAYSNLISGFIGDTQKSTEYTKKLIETSAVIASRTGRTVEDVNDRIRSGLLGSTEAIEDLGINVNVALLETTDAFKQLANGRSWSKLTFQEQQQVRLFAIMEQSSKKFGDQLSGGGSASLLMFNAQLENLKLNIGRAFAPIVNVAIPALTNFITKLSEGVAKIGEFFSALFGVKSASTGVGAVAENASSAASAMGEASTAAKELKNATIGIDELNVLSADASSTGTTTSGSTGMPSGSTESISSGIDTTEIEKAANRVKGAFDKITSHPIVKWFTNKFSDAARFASERLKEFGGWAQNLAPKLESIGVKLKECAEKAWSFIEPIADTVWEEWKNTAEKLQKVWEKLGTSFAEVSDKLLILWNTVHDSLEALGILQMWQTQLQNIATFIGGTFGEVIEWVGKKIDALKETFGGFITFLDGVFSADLSKVLEGIQSMFSGWRLGIDADVGLFKGIFEKIGTFLSDTWKNAKEFGAKAWENIKSFFSELPGKLGYALGKAFGTLTKWGGDALRWAKEKPGEIVDAVVSFFKKLPDRLKGVWNSIIDFFNKLPERMANFGKNLLSGIWNGICSAGNWLKDKISDFFGGFADGFLDGLGLGKGTSESIAPIPKLASGGIAYKPTLAMIGEGADREAVLPLNSGVYSELAKGINNASSDENTSFLRSIDSRFARLLQWAENIDFNVQVLMSDREIYNAAERGRKSSGAVIVRV